MYFRPKYYTEMRFLSRYQNFLLQLYVYKCIQISFSVLKAFIIFLNGYTRQHSNAVVKWYTYTLLLIFMSTSQISCFHILCCHILDSSGLQIKTVMKFVFINSHHQENVSFIMSHPALYIGCRTAYKYTRESQ